MIGLLLFEGVLLSRTGDIGNAATAVAVSAPVSSRSTVRLGFVTRSRF